MDETSLVDCICLVWLRLAQVCMLYGSRSQHETSRTT